MILVSSILSITGTPSNGSLLIGNGQGFTVNTLTAGTNINITNGSGTITIAATASGGTPAGSTNEIQYNNAGAFGANSNLKWDITNSRAIIGTEAVADTNSRLVVIGKGQSTNTTFAVHNQLGTNNALVVRDDTKVGIGTNAPATRLHVVGNSDERIRLSNGSNNIELGCTSGNNSFVKFGSGLLLRQNGTSTQTLDLVGVGTNPTAKLDFRGGTVGDTLLSMSGGGSGNVSIISMYRGATETIRLVDNNVNDSYHNTTRSFVFGGTTRSTANAQVEMISTTQGFLLPRMTTTQRDAVAWVAGDAGMVIYNTTTNDFQGWDGTTWKNFH